MDEKEFREKYENKLKKFGYEFDRNGENEKFIQINYINKEKDALLIIGIDKETEETIAELLFFDGPEKKAEYDLTIDELFKFLEEA